MMTVALDAMGGDHAPAPEIAGAIAAARSGQLRLILVGDEARLRDELRRHQTRGLAIEIRHASEIITMHDIPSVALRRKKGSSMRVAFDLVAAGEADAVVSAGNSGAMMACAIFVLKRLEGVDRPAILTTFPSRTQKTALLDMGANVECKPLHLAQYAVLGAVYAREQLDRARPRVGLLSNGAEEHKGTPLTRATHKLLSGHSSELFDYVGYVEGRDVLNGRTDVVVCDGFSGNLVLKISEAAAELIVALVREEIEARPWAKLLALGLKPALRGLRRKIDYAELGGAPLLGVRGAALICHGGSNSKAIKNAILNAALYAERDLTGSLARAISDHRDLMAVA